MGGRQVFGGEHEHIGALGGGNRAMGQRAAVHADDQVMDRRELCHGLFIGTVAFIDAVGHVEGRFMSHRAQPVQDQGCRAATVDVIIGKDRNPFARQGGLQQAPPRFLHVLERARIGHQIAERRRKKRLCLFGHDAPAGQHLADRQRQVLPLLEGLRRALHLDARAAPLPPGQ